MSASVLRARCKTALARLVDHLTRAESGRICEAHATTIGRHLSGETQWTLDELCALIAAEQAMGQHTILDALSNPAAVPSGDPARLHDDLVSDLAQEGDLVAAEANALAEPTPCHLRVLAEKRHAHALHQAQLDADIEAAARRTA